MSGAMTEAMTGAVSGPFAALAGPYLDDLIDQPDAVSRTIEGLAVTEDLARVGARVLRGEYARVVLTGMGASYHALAPLELTLTAAGRECRLVESGELLRTMRSLLDHRALAVLVSQSGRTVEVVSLLDRGAARAQMLAVTNDGESPLARAADAAVFMRAGAESTVSCKTYLATLAALEWVGSCLCGGDPARTRDELRAAVPALREYLAAWRSHVDTLTRTLQGVRHAFVVGRGPSRASAGFGGLILKEAARFPSEGLTAGAFRHGPLEMVADDVFVLVLEGDSDVAAFSRRLVADVRGAGGRAALIGPGADEPVFRLPETPPMRAPLFEALPIEMVSLALASLRGLTPGIFNHASKVTLVE